MCVGGVGGAVKLQVLVLHPPVCYPTLPEPPLPPAARGEAEGPLRTWGLWHRSAAWLSEASTGLAGWLTWVRRGPDAPRAQVPSPVRAHTTINQ